MTTATSFPAAAIRNLVLLGGRGAGKTLLAEAILHRTGAIARMGSIEAGSTASDFQAEARAHQHSTSSSVLFATSSERELNIIDTPGHPEFIGPALAALAAVETALIVVDATVGIEFATRRLFHAAGEAGLARMIVVNKIDQVSPPALRALVDELRATFGATLHCLNLPTRAASDVIDCFDVDAGPSDLLSVADIHREVLEATVEVDDARLEAYLAGQPIDLPALRATFVRAMAQGHIVPIVFTSARAEVGIDDLVHILLEEAPSPLSGRPRRLRAGTDLIEVACDPTKPLLAQVFKVTADPHLGQVAMLRILQGRLDGTTPFVCGADKRPRKAGHVLKVEGRDHAELSAVAEAGDLVGLARAEGLHVDQLLHDPALGDDLAIPATSYPTPMMSLAVQGRSRADDVKLGEALGRLAEEDPTFRISHDPVTRELILSGMGEVHVRVMLERLEHRFKIDVQSRTPTIPYRETIGQKAEGHYRHKKQTGGAGQFAEVFLRVEPRPRGAGFEFVNEVFGGAIPSQFIPAVEKGALDAIEAGTLAGFPVHDLRVVVHDGKSHPVDSKEIAFRTAGKMAVKDALEKARPTLLEPVAALEITLPEQHMGAITGELVRFRGRVVGMEPAPGGQAVVRALAPLAELGSYGGHLRSLTGGAGSFVMELSHYEPVPPPQQAAVITSRATRAKDAD